MSSKRSYRYRVVDVFTRVPLEGNALAVFPNSDGLDDVTMQRIARELNLSETVFIEPATLSDCSHRLRIFTPLREMVFAGHPTVGGSYVLLDERMVAKGTERFSVQEKVGPVAIRIEMSDPPLIWLETPPIVFEKKFDRHDCARLLQLPADELSNIKPQIVSAGNPTLLIPLRDKSFVDQASVDMNELAKFKQGYSGPFCIFVFAPTDNGAYSRMFAPDHGILEDPATGSSTGPLGAFMKHYNLLRNSGVGRFVSEQGTKMGRRSLLHFEILTSPQGEDCVAVGGYVTPLVEAVMNL